MRRILLETPYSGEVAKNEAYARKCMADSLRRGDAPLASHLLYTQPHILDDAIPAQREMGITAGFLWGQAAAASVFYMDRGLSEGMMRGIIEAANMGRPVEFRRLGGWSLSGPPKA